ncbi:hypothetical protein M758_1G260500 [Ceratodon purpureus]|nr:hypothetical protein M758_1G260500 [Ceratodon purpureus]
MMDSMATGAFSTRSFSKPECSGRAMPVSSMGSNCYAVRFPLLSSDPTVSTLVGLHHCYDVTAVRRVVNTNEQSDDFAKGRRWRGDANGFARGRRAGAMAKVSWAPESSPVNEIPYEDFRVDVLERFGEVGGEFKGVVSTHLMRLPWSLFQPQKFAHSKGGRLRSGVRRVVDQLIQSAQPVANSLDFRCSQNGLSRSGRNGGQVGNWSMANAVNTSVDTSSSEEDVDCQVEAVSWRERHISASVRIEASQERVWEVLTDYGRLAEFIPNLTRSEQIPCPHPGRKWLLQEGKQTAMYWQIEARVVLDLEELPDAKDGKELRFSMVDGDFKRYVGRWYLRPDIRSGTTTLHYEVNVTPRLLFPAAFVEQIIKSDLPINLRAIADRAEDNILGEAGSAQLSEGFSAPVALMERAKSGEKGYTWGAIGSSCQLGKPCVVDEVHLRRFDDMLENGGVHRRVVAAITVEAPAQNVWAVLTDYERLHEFVPNLAICEVLTRDKNRVRLLQEGCKCLLYMVLHARVVLDLWERPRYEILFQQVEGDFDSFQGKWTLEPLGAQHTLLKYVVDTRMHRDSLLAEALVEEVIYEDLPANLCAIRDRVELLESSILQNGRNGVNEEKTINKQDLHEDVSKKDEARSRRRDPPRIRKRPLVAGLQRDFNILEKELLKFIAEKGTLGVMPMRDELREAGRVDLEKAIARNGGFGPVASKLDLSLAYKERKPKGYWDDLQNLHKEIMLFQKEQGKDRTLMPTRRSLEKAGRYDLARSLEKWGGLREVARVLGLQVKKQQISRTVKTDSPPPSSLKVSDINEADIQAPLKTMRPLKSKKWITMRRGAAMDSIDQ